MTAIRSPGLTPVAMRPLASLRTWARNSNAVTSDQDRLSTSCVFWTAYTTCAGFAPSRLTTRSVRLESGSRRSISGVATCTGPAFEGDGNCRGLVYREHAALVMAWITKSRIGTTFDVRSEERRVGKESRAERD